MVEAKLDPQIGEQVLVYPHEEMFEIVDRRTSAIGELLLKLRRPQDGEFFENVPSILVGYPPEERVRRELRRIAAHCDDWPEDFQEERFDVKTDEMYDGTPRIMVYFHLKPEVVPSVSKARAWNDFYRRLQEKLEPLTNSGIWLQFTAKEGRSALSAAS